MGNFIGGARRKVSFVVQQFFPFEEPQYLLIIYFKFARRLSMHGFR